VDCHSAAGVAMGKSAGTLVKGGVPSSAEGLPTQAHRLNFVGMQQQLGGLLWLCTASGTSRKSAGCSPAGPQPYVTHMCSAYNAGLVRVAAVIFNIAMCRAAAQRADSMAMRTQVDMYSLSVWHQSCCLL